MKISQRGIDLIKEFEGVRLEAYNDGANIPTIGVGHTKLVSYGDVATMEQVDAWLREDLKDAENAVNKNVKVDLQQGQFDALVSLVFNIGGGAFAKSTLLKMLNSGDYFGAADQFLVWRNAGGKVMKGLVRRREAEREMFLVMPGASL